MVGRLVEQQQVGLLPQCPCDRRPAPLAAAGGCDRPRQVDPKLVGDRRCIMGFGRVGAVQHPVEQGRIFAHVRILLEQHDALARNDGPAPLIGLDQVGDALEQSRLARAVAADEGQPVAVADMQVEAAKQPAFALDQSEVFVGEDWGRHRPAPSARKRLASL